MKAMGFLAHPPIFAQLVLGDTKLTDHQILGECGVDDGADVLLLLANLPPGLSELGFSEKHPKILRAYFDQHSVAHTDFMDEDQGVWDQLRMGSAKTLRHFFPCIFEVAPDHPGKLRVSRLRFGHSHQNLSQSRLTCQPVFSGLPTNGFDGSSVQIYPNVESTEHVCRSSLHICKSLKRAPPTRSTMPRILARPGQEDAT